MVTTMDRSSFGVLLRTYRLAAGLSQEALAERARMSVDGIGALERGVNRAPQRETLALISRALELNPDQQRTIEAAAVRPPRPRVKTERGTIERNDQRALPPIIGREKALAEIEALIAGSRLVTLTGAGGIGKTRLAIEIGRAARGGWADGSWFVDLTPLRDARDVTGAIAEVFRVRDRTDRALLEGIVRFLERKRLLLVLDTCDHLAAAVAAAAQSICARCDDVRILATSRQPLQAAGEQIYRVLPLDHSASTELFVAHATRADPSFHFADVDRPHVEHLCRRLDGVALAIELVAAHVNRFHTLADGSQLPQTQTVLALVDWSYELLDPQEQMLFARLGVFPGEFSLGAVLAVCGGNGISEENALDLLGALAAKSFVVTERREDDLRYRLSSTMRAYALQKAGDAIAVLTRRHAQYYLNLIEQMDSNSPSWLSALEPEYKNVRAILDWSIGKGEDINLGVRLLAASREFLLARGLATETARRAERSLEHIDSLPPQLQAIAWETLAAMRGDLFMPAEALEAVTRAFELYEALDDRSGMARALRGAGIARLRLGLHAAAEDDLRRSLELSRRHGTRRDVMRALASIALALEVTGRLEEARKTALEVSQMARRHGDERLIWVNVMNLAEAEFALGEIQSAVSRLQDLLTSEIERKNKRFRANAEANLAAYLIALRREDEARGMARTAVSDARESEDSGILSCALGHLAAIAARTDPKTAARLLGYVKSIFASSYNREYTERYTHELLTKRLHKALRHEEIAALERDGAEMTEDQAVRVAMRGGARSPYTTV